MRTIVGMTTWTKRIPMCIPTVKDILNQTVKVDEFAINLDREQFPNEREDVSKLCPELIELEKSNDNLKLYFQDKDMRCWQKSIPVLRRELDEPIILFTCDDDTGYIPEYVEHSVKCLQGYDYMCTSDNTHLQGQCLLYNWRAVECLRREITDDIVMNCPLDDAIINLIMHKYGLKKAPASFPGTYDKYDKNLPHSFRRCFIHNNDSSEVRHGQYPQEEFQREFEYLRKKGVI